jgi:hypothetical protein
MSYGVDARVETMQPTGAYPPVDLLLTPPCLQQLRPSHHPMLPPRQLGKATVVSARPQKVVLYKVFCGLGGQTLSVTGLGARVVRRSRLL